MKLLNEKAISKQEPSYANRGVKAITDTIKVINKPLNRTLTVLFVTLQISGTGRGGREESD